jgi:hypothetical protein
LCVEEEEKAVCVALIYTIDDRKNCLWWKKLKSWRSDIVFVGKNWNLANKNEGDLKMKMKLENLATIMLK